MGDRMDHAEGHVGELHCCGCPTANIHDIPPSLLAEVFASLEAYARIRLRRVCSEWRDQLTSHRLTTNGIFLDMDQLYLKTDIAARLETFINGKNFTYNYEYERAERGFERLAYCVSSKILPPEVTTLYVRIREPIKTYQKLVRKKSFYSQCFSILVKSFLRELFGGTYAQRIVLCDSLLLEDFMTISIVTPDKANEDEMVVSFNRFYWVRASMKDLTLWNCRVLVKPLTPGGHTDIVLTNFSFRLEKGHKPLDMVCAFRDACCPRPDITACKHHIQSGLSLREAGPEVMENAQTASRTSWLKQYVSRIPEDIGKKNTGEMDFYKMKNSSLFLLHMYLYRG